MPRNTLLSPQFIWDHPGAAAGTELGGLADIALKKKRGGKWRKNVPSSPLVELNHMYIFKIQRKGTTLQHMFKSRVLFQRFQKISG